MKITSFILFFFLFFLVTSAFACPGYKQPTTTLKQTHELCYSHYMVLYNDSTKTPVYAAEALTAQDIADSNAINRHDAFHAESKLPKTVQSSPSDYSNTGYDKGHIVPAGDQPTMSAQAESFSMANMVPQDPTNNRQTWRLLETQTRDYASKNGYVYMISGPIYTDISKTIHNGISIPQKLFKVWFDKDHKYIHGWIVDNTATAVPKEVTLAELESQTKLKF